MFERFSSEARAAVIRAQARARARATARNGREVTCVDLLQALAEPESSVAETLGARGLTPDTLTVRDGDAEALRTLGIDLDAIREAVETTFGAGVLEQGPSSRGHLPFARRTKKALELSLRETIRLHSRTIGAAQLALGVLRADDPEVARLLARQQVDVPSLRADLEEQARRAA